MQANQENRTYCHNCGVIGQIVLSGAYCAYCANFFYRAGRLPRPTDPTIRTDALSRAYEAMGWELPN